MKQYLEILQEVLDKGTMKAPARDNMPATISRFSIEKRFDLLEGFPLVTTKKMFTKGIIHELLWFLKGDTNIHYLVKNGVNIWNEDGYKYYRKGQPIGGMTYDQWIEYVKSNNDWAGDLGKIYSHQWRSFGYFNHGYVGSAGVDQITNVINNIKSNPESRYHVVTAWNPVDVSTGNAALPACHMMFQFNCRRITDDKFIKQLIGIHLNSIATGDYPRYYLDCKVIQRSCDTPLGVPFNIASYALLTMIIAKLTNTIPGELIWSGNDVHIYENQIDIVKEQLSRTPHPLPYMHIRGNWDTIDDIKFDDFHLMNYISYDKLDYPLSTGLIK